MRARFAIHSALREAPLERDQVVELCAFRVGDEKYALDLSRVEEVIRPPRPARIPREPAFIEGVFNLRGAIVPIVDLRKRFGLTARSLGARARCIVCRLARDRVAVLVDGGTEVVRVRIADLRPAPPMTCAGAKPYVIGVCGAGDDLTLLLDLKALFQSAPGGTGDSP
jgi:purine-binding chemotaxis protein CheW